MITLFLLYPLANIPIVFDLPCEVFWYSTEECMGMCSDAFGSDLQLDILNEGMFRSLRTIGPSLHCRNESGAVGGEVGDPAIT